METSKTRAQHAGRRQFIMTGILGVALLALMVLATFSGPSSAGAYMPNIAPTPFAPMGFGPIIKIKFQAPTSPGVAGYLADTGAVYGDRGNGQTYGWDRHNVAYAFDRNVVSDEQLDTGIRINDDPAAVSGAAAKWEIALPPGWYQLVVTAGDPGTITATYTLQAEDMTIIARQAGAKTPRSFQNTPIVRVLDGRLTLQSRQPAAQNALLSLQIIPHGYSLQRPMQYKTRINFQPAGAPPVENHLIDAGHVFGTRGGGWRYGWNVDNTAWMVDRNSPSIPPGSVSTTPDQRYDTFAYLRKEGVARTWSMEVPIGYYWVTVGAGDPSPVPGTNNSITVQGIQLTFQDTSDTLQWREGRVQVYINDGGTGTGRGYIQIASKTLDNYTAINFIEISQGEETVFNVAQSKRARQPMTYQGNSAWRAVDGNANGDLAAGSVAMTNTVPEAFWEVDLGANHRLRSIGITPRNAYQSRLDNFWVLYSPDPFVSNSLSEAKAQVGVNKFYVSEPLLTRASWLVTGSARYVRVQLEGTNYLQLAEVEVMADFLGGMVWQGQASSTASDSDVKYAVDFNAMSSWRSGGAQTAGMFYKVDMGTPQTFSKLQLFSSGTNYPRAFNVYVTDAATEYTGPSSGWDRLVASGTGTSNSVTITFSRQTARYLMVELTATAPSPWEIETLTVSP